MLKIASFQGEFKMCLGCIRFRAPHADQFYCIVKKACFNYRGFDIEHDHAGSFIGLLKALIRRLLKMVAICTGTREIRHVYI